MDNWKEKARQIRAERDETEKQIALENDRRRQQECEDEIEQKRNILGKKFRCAVCGVPANEPAVVRDTSEGGGGYWCDDDWSIPGDLWQCEMCNKWACAEHIEAGICKNCVQKFTSRKTLILALLQFVFVALIILCVVVIFLG